MLHKRLPDSAEARRLEALRALEILDTPAEHAFDALASLASQLLDCPIGLVTLIDEHRQWIKARVGTDLEQTPREVAFCDHTIRSDAPLIVPDAADDLRFAANPLVTGAGGIRFYAGMALHAPDPIDGTPKRIGAICAADRRPREVTPAQQEALRSLGILADALLAARGGYSQAVDFAENAHRQALELRRSDLIFRQAEQLAAIGSWRYSFADAGLQWSDGVFRIHGLPIGQPPSLDHALAFYPASERSRIVALLDDARRHGTSFDFETDMMTATGSVRRVRSMGMIERIEDQPAALVGVFQDITERHQLEQSLRRSADTDEVTRIANRAAFNRALKQAIDEAGGGGDPLMLILIDLDFFKQINDQFGHGAGDDVLRAMAWRLKSGAYGNGLAARLGGDEFALIVRRPELCADADQLVERLLDDLRQPIDSSHGMLRCGATIGYALFDPAHQHTLRELVHATDGALYEAKRAGRGVARRYRPGGRRAGDRGAEGRAAG